MARPTEKHLIKDDEGKALNGLVIVRPGVYWQPPERPAFIVAHPNPTSEHMIKHGIFEQPLIAWCCKFFTGAGADETDFIDIGAHAGTYALSLAPYCRQVHAFEAQRMTYYQLCGGIALNHYQNVWPHHCALGEAKGTAELNITSTDGGGSTLDPQVPKNQNMRVLRREECPVETLDSFGLFSGKVAMIKIDVEGHELAVLRGARETIARNDRPPILFEAWPDQWYQADKKRLWDFITSELGYNSITAAPYSNNMFVALK